jgi:hypothetical protein
MIEPTQTQNLVPNPVSNEPPKPACCDLFKKPIFWIILGVILFIFAVILYFLPSLLNKPDAIIEETKPVTVTPDINKIIVEKAPQGELITGFPSGLIVDKSAIINGSAENVSNDPKTQILATSYKTELSATVINQKYLDMFKKEQWTIYNNNQSTNQLSIFAGKASLGSVNISYFKNAEGNFVVILFHKSK